MGKIRKVLKETFALPGSKIFITIMIVGLGLFLFGRFYTKPETSLSVQNETVVHSDQEKKLAGILSEMEGVGEVEVIIETRDKTSSVLVLCENADDPTVRLSIKQAVRALLQTENIKIIKKKI